MAHRQPSRWAIWRTCISAMVKSEGCWMHGRNEPRKHFLPRPASLYAESSCHTANPVLSELPELGAGFSLFSRCAAFPSQRGFADTPFVPSRMGCAALSGDNRYMDSNGHDPGRDHAPVIAPLFDPAFGCVAVEPGSTRFGPSRG